MKKGIALFILALFTICCNVTNRGKSLFKVQKPEGTIMPGNSNLGHPYGTGLSDDDRWDLIEYMKSL